MLPAFVADNAPLSLLPLVQALAAAAGFDVGVEIMQTVLSDQEGDASLPSLVESASLFWIGQDWAECMRWEHAFAMAV